MYYWVTVSFILVSIPVRIVAQDTTIHVGSDGIGNAKLGFTPSSIHVTKGSIVAFVFDGIPGNHTVAQSSFDKPCEPLAGGFDTGFIFVPLTTDAASPLPTFNLTIEDDTKPIFFYCAQLTPQPHCISGMVGAINAPVIGNTFSSYAAIAAAASSVVAPIPALSGVNAFATAGPGPIIGILTSAAVSTNSFSNTADPTVTLSVPGISGTPSPSSTSLTPSITSSGGESSSASGTSSISGPVITTDLSACPSSRTDIRGLLAFFTAALAAGLAINIAGIVWLFKIRRSSRRGDNIRRAREEFALHVM